MDDQVVHAMDKGMGENNFFDFFYQIFLRSLTKERIILEGNIPSPIKPPSGCKFHTRCYMACDKCKRVPPELKEVKPGHFVACHFADQQKIDENGNYLFDIKTITNQR